MSIAQWSWATAPSANCSVAHGRDVDAGRPAARDRPARAAARGPSRGGSGSGSSSRRPSARRRRGPATERMFLPCGSSSMKPKLTCTARTVADRAAGQQLEHRRRLRLEPARIGLEQDHAGWRARRRTSRSPRRRFIASGFSHSTCLPAWRRRSPTRRAGCWAAGCRSRRCRRRPAAPRSWHVCAECRAAAAKACGLGRIAAGHRVDAHPRARRDVARRTAARCWRSRGCRGEAARAMWTSWQVGDGVSALSILRGAWGRLQDLTRCRCTSD